MTILVMITLVILGTVSYNLLPVSDLPNIEMPTIQVDVDFPGANAQTMANSVAVPLEQQFATIEGINSIFSSSNIGNTTIVLQFVLGRDMNAASTDVQAAINRAEPYLPTDLPNNPTYKKVNPASTPVLYYVLYSDNMTLGQLYDYGNTFIGRRISMVDGVAQVLTYGSPYAVRVQVDPEKLAAKNIGINDVASIIQQGNVDLPLGTLWGAREDFTVDADGQLFSASPYEELIIKNDDGNLVKVKDVGRALDSVKDERFYCRYITRDLNKQCIIIGIQRLPDSNTLNVIAGVKKTLEGMKDQIPENLQIVTLYDQSHSIIDGVNDVKMTLLISMVLVVLIVYVFLGKLLNTIIPGLAIPISILGTFALMVFYHFNVDLLSLLAITLSIGFLVDDAIVVLENNVRHVQMGEDPIEAAIRGSKEISITILSMTLCLSAAFIPMLFMGGVMGLVFREFAVTLVTVVMISGFVSLSLTPLLCSRFVKPYVEGHKTKMERFADRVMDKLKAIYEVCLKWAMNHRLTMLFLGFISVFGTIVLLILVPKDFLQSNDVGFIDGYTLARDGTSPYLMDKYHADLCKIVMDDPNLDSLISISSYSNANEGMLFLKLLPYSKRKPVDQVISELTRQLKDEPGVQTFLSRIPLINLQVGTTATALYQYSLSSINQKALYDYSPKLLSKMINHPEFSQVSSDLRFHQPQWSMHILRDRAANFGLQAQDIETILTNAYSDNKISQINGEINQYDVLIETLPQFNKNPTVLPSLYVKSPKSGALVPLAEVVEINEIASPLTVNHLNGLPAVVISFNPEEQVPLGRALEELENLSQDKPELVHGKVIGTAEVFRESLKSLPILLLLSLFAIYVILGILYESFIHPITIMSSLPPALFGGIASLFIFKENLSIYSFIGLILAMGIVLKNGIIMVDFANDAVRNEGKSARDAIEEAALVRFRPILMTTIAAIMGAVPIAIGLGGPFAATIRSLGICIIGGLIVSQALTLLLTPVLYYYFEMLQESIRKRYSTQKE